MRKTFVSFIETQIKLSAPPRVVVVVVVKSSTKFRMLCPGVFACSTGKVSTSVFKSATTCLGVCWVCVYV